MVIRLSFWYYKIEGFCPNHTIAFFHALCTQNLRRTECLRRVRHADCLKLSGNEDRTFATQVMTGSGLPYQSGRVAYTFNLQGPCNGIDTACSSSLVAAHNARQGEGVYGCIPQLVR